MAWCRENPHAGAVVTSLPDPENIILPDDSMYTGRPWAWFREAIDACAAATHPGAPLVLRQTDRRDDGTRSKAALAFDVLLHQRDTEWRCLWHKIVLHQDPETTNIHRPTYSHLLAFGRNGVGPGRRTPDVLRPGDRLYANGMGLATAERVVQFAGTAHECIVDPFCGRGTVPVMADALGYSAIGIDLDPGQVACARGLSLSRP